MYWFSFVNKLVSGTAIPKHDEEFIGHNIIIGEICCPLLSWVDPTVGENALILTEILRTIEYICLASRRGGPYHITTTRKRRYELTRLRCIRYLELYDCIIRIILLHSRLDLSSDSRAYPICTNEQVTLVCGVILWHCR